MGVKEVHQIIIEFDGQHIRVKCPDDVMITFGMLRLAESEILAKLKGHSNENEKIIVPARKERVSYPPEPK